MITHHWGGSIEISKVIRDRDCGLLLFSLPESTCGCTFHDVCFLHQGMVYTRGLSGTVGSPEKRKGKQNGKHTNTRGLEGVHAEGGGSKGDGSV